MTTLLTITEKGQMTLSKAVREALGVKPGEKISLTVKGKQAIIEPAGKGILDLAGTLPPFKIPKGKTLDDLIHEAHGGDPDEAIR